MEKFAVWPYEIISHYRYSVLFHLLLYKPGSLDGCGCKWAGLFDGQVEVDPESVVCDLHEIRGHGDLELAALHNEELGQGGKDVQC